MSVVPVLVIVLATAAASPRTTAADATPNLPETTTATPAAKDFIRSRCDTTCRERPEAAEECSKLLLPFAASINGSYIRTSHTAATVMVSELGALARELGEFGRAHPEYKLAGCARMAEEAVAGAKAPLAELRRLDAVGDEKMDELDLNLRGVGEWLDGVKKSFQQECRDGGLKNIRDPTKEMPRAGVVENAIYASGALVSAPTPYSSNFVAYPL
jgi:hypothetical protein